MAKKSRRLREPDKNTGKRVAATDPPNYEEMPPVFSLERLQGSPFCLSDLDREQKAGFADAVFRRRQVSWRDLKQTGRHGLGFEKIPKTQIKTGIPRFITEDYNHFLAFRFKGQAPMVGYRVRNVFYVLWFDPNFELYDH